MADDQVAGILQEIRDKAGKRVAAMRCDVTGGAVPRLLDALEEVLKPHAPRADGVLGSSCFTHRNTRNSMLPVPGCETCVHDGQREVCPECRDQFGDPVPFEDCRARTAALAALTGKEKADG